MQKTVLLVEDDPELLRRYRESLEKWGYLSVVEADSVAAALTQVTAQKELAAVVIDLHLRLGDEVAAEILRDYNYEPSGYALARKIRDVRKDVPVFGMTAHMEQIKSRKNCQDWFCNNGDPSRLVGVYLKDQQWMLLRHHILVVTEQETFVRVFIIHGHDHETRDHLRKYADGLKWKVEVLAETPARGQTWIERFEDKVDEASLAWVLFTPDEWGCPLRGDLDAGLQARPNVLLECGYCLGKFGRQSFRNLLFIKGKVKLPSDLDGVARINLRGSVADADKDIRRELEPWIGPWKPVMGSVGP